MSEAAASGRELCLLMVEELLMSDPPPGPSTPSTVLRSRIDGPLIHATVV